MTTTSPLGPTCTPRGWELILEVQSPHGHKPPPGRTPVLKPSSNSGLTILNQLQQLYTRKDIGRLKGLEHLNDSNSVGQNGYGIINQLNVSAEQCHP